MSEPPRPSRFAVNLDPDDNLRFDRLVRRLGDAIGRVPSHRGQRLPSRADLLRALLVVAENDEQVEQAAHEQVRVDAARHAAVDES